MYQLFGNLLTHYGSASLNHGQSRGNVSPLQKAWWHDKIHSTVSGDAIRWALRYYWQQQDYPVNRVWNADTFKNLLTNEDFDPVRFIDDDVLGYMKTEAAKEEIIQEELETQNKQNKEKRGKKSKGNSIPRLGALGVTRAISLTLYNGTISLNARSGEPNRTSLHNPEYHNTRYQYGFALDPNHLKDKSRLFAVIDGLMSIRKVGGHNNVFCYDFSPESMVFRWTQKNSPHIFYCFQQDSLGLEPIISSDLIEQVEVEDIDGSELWIGGKVAKNLHLKDAHIFQGREKAVADLKRVIARDLNLTEFQPSS
ncbi:type I-B CRISPR-associated protein Cas7/Cst2/DevR [Allocoleopsis sp.]|uniref:type I-B CRISPR-associated protein Cas7/Cst2/DevR n=1 Tax=Allocoleopsis sp. TaxID=3088169 RepID=UPI002FCF3F0C